MEQLPYTTLVPGEVSQCYTSLQNRAVDQLYQACTFIKTENIAVNDIGLGLVRLVLNAVSVTWAIIRRPI